MPKRDTSKLQAIVAMLRAHYERPTPTPASNAFQLVLWEQAAYLADDARRAAAFAALRRRVGLSATAILEADPSVLAEVASVGGPFGKLRARRMRESAELVVGDYDGHLDDVLALPLAEARRVFRRFPMIGAPGADKILLFTHTHPLLALDSNGGRSLRRIGYGVEKRSYSSTYKSVVDAASPQVVPDCDWLIDAHLLLRQHGKQTCKVSMPRCEICPVRVLCAYAEAHAERTAGRSRALKRPSRPPRSPA